MAVGYLVNFGRRGELEWKRFILTDLHPDTNAVQIQRKEEEHQLAPINTNEGDGLQAIIDPQIISLTVEF